MSVGDDYGIDCAARLARGKTDIVEADPLDRLAGEQRVAEISTTGAQADAGRIVMPRRRCEKRPLIDIAGDAMLRVDLLQADNVGIELADNLGDALRIKTSVHAATRMDVVSCDNHHCFLEDRENPKTHSRIFVSRSAPAGQPSRARAR